jgi:hypothetical protein
LDREIRPVNKIASVNPIACLVQQNQLFFSFFGEVLIFWLLEFIPQGGISRQK